MKSAGKRKRGLGNFIFSLVMAVALFIALLMVEKTLMTPNGLKSVYIATAEIEKGTIIEESTVGSLFIQKEVDGDLGVTNAVTDLNTLIGSLTNQKIEKGAVIASTGFVDADTLRLKTENPLMISIAVEGLETGVSGIVRPGDIITVAYVNEESQSTDFLLTDVLVEKSYDAAGKELKRGDEGIANLFSMYVNVNQASRITQVSENSKLRVVKVENKY